MTWPLRASSRHVAAAIVIVAATLAAQPALAEIFKCSAKDGTLMYQNFPCDVSLGSLPSQPTADKPNTAGNAKHPIVEPSGPVASGDVVPVAETGPEVGMSEDQIRSMMGNPDEIVEDEPRSGRISVWRYGDRGSVTFDVKRRVISVQQFSMPQ